MVWEWRAVGVAAEAGGQPRPSFHRRLTAERCGGERFVLR